MLTINFNNHICLKDFTIDHSPELFWNYPRFRNGFFVNIKKTVSIFKYQYINLSVIIQGPNIIQVKAEFNRKE